MYWFKSYLITKSCKCKNINVCTFACANGVITIILNRPNFYLDTYFMDRIQVNVVTITMPAMPSRDTSRTREQVKTGELTPASMFSLNVDKPRYY